jgi:hypothetical protein
MAVGAMPADKLDEELAVEYLQRDLNGGLKMANIFCVICNASGIAMRWGLIMAVYSGTLVIADDFPPWVYVVMLISQSMVNAVTALMYAGMSDILDKMSYSPAQELPEDWDEERQCNPLWKGSWRGALTESKKKYNFHSLIWGQMTEVWSFVSIMYFWSIFCAWCIVGMVVVYVIYTKQRDQDDEIMQAMEALRNAKGLPPPDWILAKQNKAREERAARKNQQALDKQAKQGP